MDYEEDALELKTSNTLEFMALWTELDGGRNYPDWLYHLYIDLVFWSL